MIRTLAAAAIVAAPLVLLPTPAGAARNATQADHIEVRHYAPDSGYTRDLLIRCGQQGYLIREGHSSTEFRHVPLHPDCEGVTSIYVRAGEEWWARADGVGLWRKRFDTTGWHNLPSTWEDGAGIVLHKD